MSTPPTPPLPKRPHSTLAKLAIAFAVTIAITFGLCTVTLMSSNSAMNGPAIPTALAIEAICIVGLIVVAVTAIARRPQDK